MQHVRRGAWKNDGRRSGTNQPAESQLRVCIELNIRCKVVATLSLSIDFALRNFASPFHFRVFAVDHSPREQNRTQIPWLPRRQ